MKKLLPLLLVSLLLGACGGGKKLHFAQEGVTAKPRPDVSRDAFLEQKWSYRLDDALDALSGRLRPAHDDDQVIFAGPRGTVAAVETATGTRRWEVDLDQVLIGGVGNGDGLVMVANQDGEIIALNRDDGSEVWRTMVGGEVLAPPVVAPGVAVVRVGDSRVVGLDTADGQSLWSVAKSVDGLTVRGVSTPLINGRGTVIGLADGRLLALDVDRGAVLWETPIGTRRGANEVGRLADIDADPALLGTVLYVASYQSQVVAMALGTPRAIWSAEVSTLKNFGLDADRIFITTDTGSIVALNRYTGDPVWEQDQLSGRGLSGPLAVGDMLIVGDFEGYLYHLDPESGAIRAAQRIGDAIVQAPRSVDDLVMVVTERGRVHLFGTL